MITRRFSAEDGTPLCADVYAPPSSASASASAEEKRGLIVLVHGYCEHRGRYRDTAGFLARQGFEVACLDLRGHGDSGGRRAHVERFDDYLKDVAALVALVAGDRQPLLLGHSMGGLVALSYALRHQGQLRALMMSSPLFGIKLKIPLWKRGLAELFSRVLPTLSLPSDLDPAFLSHDPKVVEGYAHDPLVSHHATTRWFTEAVSAQARALRGAPGLRLPTLLLCAGDDRIVDAAASQRLFDRIGASDKMMTLYPGLYHEIFNEVERERVLQDLAAWLKGRS